VKISSTGVTVDVPQGWEAEIYQREPERFELLEAEASTGAVVHLGNFPLPPERGDFGSGAVEIMKGDHVLVVLFEHGADSVGTRLFSATGMPQVTGTDFRPDRMQRPLPGQSGAQYFFTIEGRPFCLYVALGSHANRAEIIPLVNETLATVTIA